MIIIDLALIGAALTIARALHVIRWPWWIVTAPVFVMPIAVFVLSVAVFGGTVFAALALHELVTGKRAPAWFESRQLEEAR